MSHKLAQLAYKGAGSHFIYEDDEGRFIVEWYDFGEKVPYESANLIILDSVARSAMAVALGLRDNLTMQEFARELENRFASYFEVRAFLDAGALPYQHEVDFQP